MLEIIDQTRTRYLEKYFKDIQYYYNETLKVLGKDDEKDASLIIVGRKKIHNINRQYRNIDRETDVISFAEIDYDGEFGDNSYLGDIFINVDRVKSQAKKYGHSEKREFCFLFVHGMLHLSGYDHMTKEEEKEMFDLQDKIIGDLK
ncbi:MAG: rRNA maturation RNase YbeY [Erysipelotrichaceae bacterium]